MSFLKKLFGRKKRAETDQRDQLPWIEAAANQWAGPQKKGTKK
jgi:hypothetical protein